MFKYKLGDVTSILRPVFVARAVKGLIKEFLRSDFGENYRSG